ncbi:MAG: hypothetical protein H7841_11585 [Magnetospirillum sp. WYHS-4]
MWDEYFVGITKQRHAGGIARLGSSVVRPANLVYPRAADVLEFGRPMLSLLKAEDPEVRHCHVGAVLGRYGRSLELSLGLDFSVGRNFKAMHLAAALFRLARDHGQTDAFIARKLHDDEWTDSSRPSLTVRFRQPQRIRDLAGLIDLIGNFPGEGWPIDGFTTIPAGQGSVALVSGLRYIFLPEISIRWDLSLRRRIAAEEFGMDIILLDQATKIGRLCLELNRLPAIADARLNWSDVIVGGIEDYDDLIARLAVLPEDLKKGLMCRRAFSERLDLTNQQVLAQRMAHLAGDRSSGRGG